MQDWPGLIEAYRAWLPVTSTTPVITLREGATPLIPVPAIEERIGKGVKVFVKYDGLNPTGSFKDRGMTMAISKAKEAGCEAVICASTGNTSAAAAAYARRGGMRAFVLIPDGYVAQGKLAQALVYGAEVLAIRGNFDRALDIVREAAEKYPVTLVNSVNPYRLQGQKTAAFEIVDALGDAPDWLCIPMGNAGNITAYWMGFQEYRTGRSQPHTAAHDGLPGQRLRTVGQRHHRERSGHDRNRHSHRQSGEPRQSDRRSSSQQRCLPRRHRCRNH
jgi:threonine synthase